MVGNQLLSHMLAEAHLDRKDVHILIDAQDRHEKLFRNGGADVVMSYEPYKSGLAAAGAHDIYDTNAIPNEVIDVLAVRENIYQQRREDVCALLHQWFATQRYVDEHPRKPIRSWRAAYINPRPNSRSCSRAWRLPERRTT